MAHKDFSKDRRDILRARPFRRADRVGAVCAPWTLLLPDAAEGLLTEGEQRALDQHLATCPACAEELAEAQRGLAWLTVLKDEAPEPPAMMLASILAQTTGYAEAGVSLPPLAHMPGLQPVTLVPAASNSITWQGSEAGWRSWVGLGEASWASLMQPRLAMTGAMAFFSICLTLNLLGVSVDQLNAETLRNGGIHRTVADTSATLVRSIQGLRMVYRVESRVSEMRAQTEDANTPAKH
jgi:hypothetical protein